MESQDRTGVNTDKPTIHCGVCGGKCRVGYDPIYKRGARVIHCNSGKPRMGPCAWTDINVGRIDPAWYWKMRIRLGV
jgi:hypothetical protein